MKAWRKHNASMESKAKKAETPQAADKLRALKLTRNQARTHFSSEEKNPSGLLVNMLARIGLMPTL